MKKILLSSILVGLSYFSQAQTSVIFWDFNSAVNDASTSTGTDVAVTGTGTISSIGGATQTYATGVSNDPNTTDNSGYQTTGYPAQSTTPKTAGIQFSANTTGASNLTLSFWQRLSNTAANTWVVQYTLDATATTPVWVDAQTFTFTPAPSGTGDTWYLRTVDFSAVTGLNNNANAAFRVVSDYDPVAGTYLAARSTSAYGGGTARFDLIQLSEPVVIPPSASIVAASNFVVVEENAGTIQVPITIVNGNATASKIAIGLSTYSDAILDTDFTWVNDTIDVPANTSGIINFPITIIDDALAERAERIIVKMIGGINMDIAPTNNYQIITIKDNDYVAPQANNELNMSLLTSFSNGAAGTNSAEIVAYDSSNYRLYVANSIGSKLDIINFANPATPVLLNSVDITSYGNINSVTVHNGTVVLAIENANAQLNGSVVFLNADGVLISQVTVGAMPDMITFNRDFTKILTANEGEPSSDYSVDPEGSISIIDLTPGYAALTNANVTTIGFTAYNSQETQLLAQGIRIFSTSATVAQDLEPEYITISTDNTKAYVAIQENNALAVIDIATATIDTIHALGYSDYSSGNGLDASDQSGAVLIGSAPVKGAYMPDAIAFSTINGQGYVFSANEGDSREFGSVVDADRINGLNLDPTAFPDQHILKNNKLFGRLNGLTYSGDTDDDGDLDEIHVMGGRSFSIWNASTGTLVFDSKDWIEQITAAHPTFGTFFNASNTSSTATLKNRSDDKGPEPEGITTAEIDGNHYVFVSLERIGGVMIFNVNDPQAPVYVGYSNNRTLAGNGPDLGAEGIIYISKEESPNGNALVILANEVSSTLSIYQINTCAELSGAELEATATSICAGDSTELGFESVTGTTFEWQINGAPIATATNDTIFVQTAGTYSVAIQNNTLGCQAVSNEIEITVNALPTVTATASENAICDGEDVTLNGGGAETYVWDNSVVDNTPITPTATTTYSVIGTDVNGCSNQASVEVIVNENPTVSLGDDTTRCVETGPIVLDAGNHSSYTWSNAATTQTISVATTGTYSVTVTNDSGCSASDQVLVTFETCTSLETLSLVAKVYPNPTSSHITIETGSMEMEDVTIYDVHGRIWNEMSPKSVSTTVDLTNLPAGIYQLKITTANGVYHQSISKQ